MQSQNLRRCGALYHEVIKSQIASRMVRTVSHRRSISARRMSMVTISRAKAEVAHRRFRSIYNRAVHVIMPPYQSGVESPRFYTIRYDNDSTPA